MDHLRHYCFALGEFVSTISYFCLKGPGNNFYLPPSPLFFSGSLCQLMLTILMPWTAYKFVASIACYVEASIHLNTLTGDHQLARGRSIVLKCGPKCEGEGQSFSGPRACSPRPLCRSPSPRLGIRTSLGLLMS